MLQVILDLEINVIQNYEFKSWELCPVSGFVKKAHFISESESDPNISFLTLAFFSYRYKRVHDDITSGNFQNFQMQFKNSA